jgi:hypothetical protein
MSPPMPTSRRRLERVHADAVPVVALAVVASDGIARALVTVAFAGAAFAGAAALAGCEKGHAPPPPRSADAGPMDLDAVGPIYGPIDGTWRTFAVPGEPLRVDFPGVPREQLRTIPTDKGELVQRIWSVADRAAGRVFMVAVDRWPEGTTAPDAPLDEALRAAADTCVARKIAVDVDQRPLDLGGVPGLDVRVRPRTDARHHVRVFRLGETVYCVSAMASGGKEMADMARFIDSIAFAGAAAP